MSDLLQILVIDDDEVDRLAVRRSLRAAGLADVVEEAATVADAMVQLASRPFDCVFLDFNLPDGTGLQVLERMQRAAFRAPVIVLTGQGDEQTAVELMKAGASDYIPKNLATTDRLKAAVPAVVRVFRAEQGQREAEERLRLAVDAARIGTWDFKPDTLEVAWSDLSKRMFGVAEDTTLSFDAFLSLLHPDDRVAVQSELSLAVTPTTDDDFQIHFRFVRPDGGTGWVRAAGRALFRGEGQTRKAYRVIGTMSDVSAQKQAEEYLRRYAEQLRGLADASLAINSTLSLEEMLQAITDHARLVIGAHQSVTSLTIANDWAQAINAVSFSSKYAAYADYEGQPDGTGIYAIVCESNLPIRMTQSELQLHPRWRGFGEHAATHPPMRGWLAAPLVARDGTNLGLIQLSDRFEGEFTEGDEAVLVQLAQLASVAIENARLFQQVQEAVRTREEVLAIVSHDLRNPLNTVLASASLLTDLPLTPQQQEQQLEIIKRTGHQMNRLLQDLLDVSRMDANRFSVELDTIDGAQVISEACGMFTAQAQSKKVVFDCHIHDELPRIRADRVRLAQVFSNLISNAIRHTPAGGRIAVSAQQKADAVEFSVSDTGTGIAQEDLPHIFERFWQARRARRMGAGLGLAIVKGIVEAHGGSITVLSESGQGTTFLFSVPAAGIALAAR